MLLFGIIMLFIILFKKLKVNKIVGPQLMDQHFRTTKTFYQHYVVTLQCLNIQTSSS